MPNKVNHSFNALLKVHYQIQKFSLIRLYGNVVYRVEKSYVDKLVARYPLHFNLLSTSPEFSIDQNQFLFKKVQVGKDQENAQSEKDSHSKNRGWKKPN